MFSLISAIVTDYINNVLRLIGTKWILYFERSLQPSRYESHLFIKIISRAALTYTIWQINTESQMCQACVHTLLGHCIFCKVINHHSLWKDLPQGKKNKKALSLVISVGCLESCCFLSVRGLGLQLFSSCLSLSLFAYILGQNSLKQRFLKCVGQGDFRWCVSKYFDLAITICPHFCSKDANGVCFVVLSLSSGSEAGKSIEEHRGS